MCTCICKCSQLNTDLPVRVHKVPTSASAVCTKAMAFRTPSHKLSNLFGSRRFAAGSGSSSSELSDSSSEPY